MEGKFEKLMPTLKKDILGGDRHTRHEIFARDPLFSQLLQVRQYCTQFTSNLHFYFDMNTLIMDKLYQGVYGGIVLRAIFVGSSYLYRAGRRVPQGLSTGNLVAQHC